MKIVKYLVVASIASALIVLLSFSIGSCWQFPAGPVVTGPSACPPPCPPAFGFSCGPKFGFEGGARAFYSTNIAKIKNDQGPDIDFTDDLNFSSNTLLAEVYGALRLPPKWAFTYSYVIPREDFGYGTLTADVIVGDTRFDAGTQVAARSLTSLHRWEGEWFVMTGCNFRGGGYALGELYIETFEMRDEEQSDQDVINEFLMGLGGTGEYASNNFFVKVKGAYTFLQDQTGFYVDAEAKLFPKIDPCGPMASLANLRPYGAIGYRYRQATWDRDNSKTEIIWHGPTATLGIVF